MSVRPTSKVSIQWLGTMVKMKGSWLCILCWSSVPVALWGIIKDLFVNVSLPEPSHIPELLLDTAVPLTAGAPDGPDVPRPQDLPEDLAVSENQAGEWLAPCPPPQNDLKWQVWQAFTVIRWNDLYFSHWLPGASLHFPPNDNRFNQQSVNISVNLRLFWDKNYWWIRWWWRRAGKDKNTGRDMVQSAKLQQPLVNNKLHFSRLKSFWYFFYKN